MALDINLKAVRTVKIGMDQFPHLAILFNVIGVGTLIPLFFVLLASFKQAKKDRIMMLWFVALGILMVFAFTFSRDWLQIVPPTPTPPFDNQIPA